MKEMIIHEDLRRKWKEILRSIYSIKQDFQIPVRMASVSTETADRTCRNSSKGHEFFWNIYSRNSSILRSFIISQVLSGNNKLSVKQKNDEINSIYRVIQVSFTLFSPR
jgi:hypothetical protein